MLLALVLACTGADTVVATPPVLPTPPPSLDTADTAVVVDTDPADTERPDTDRPDTDVPDTDALVLHGVVPANALPLPTFAVHNFDGTDRGPEALLGHVTVMWFLPAANTGG